MDDNGNPVATRVPAASNNFGIHVKHLRDLIERIDGGFVQFESLPPPDPEFSGVFDCSSLDISGFLSHSFRLTVESQGAVSGTSFWTNGTFSLSGSVGRFGIITFSDNGPSLGFVGAAYAGSATARKDGFAGLYVSGSQSGSWSCDER